MSMPMNIQNPALAAIPLREGEDRGLSMGTRAQRVMQQLHTNELLRLLGMGRN